MSTSVRIVCARCGTEHPTWDDAVRCCQTAEERP